MLQKKVQVGLSLLMAAAALIFFRCGSGTSSSDSSKTSTATATANSGTLTSTTASATDSATDTDTDASTDSTPTVTLMGDGVAAAALLGKGTIDAATMVMKVFKFAVSTSVTCSEPIEVFASDVGIEKDMLKNPTFGSGKLAAGTYPCVMIEVSKVIKTAASTTSGACTADEEFDDVICQDDQQDSQTIAGDAVSCTGGSANEQHVTLFITTLSAGSSGAKSLLPPSSDTDADSSIKLTSALVIDGDKSVKFTVDPTNFMDGSQGGVCGTSAPTFAFE